jgi:hypothetical protein
MPVEKTWRKKNAAMILPRYAKKLRLEVDALSTSHPTLVAKFNLRANATAACPDPNADQGKQHMIYWLDPHSLTPG